MEGQLGQPTLALARVSSLAHSHEGHPESPGRFSLLDAVLIDAPSGTIREMETMPAARDSVARVHPRAYLDALQAACQRGPGYLDPDTYVTPGSYDAALMAAGATVKVLEAILSGQAQSGFAIIRPPGHHASAKVPMGFCLLNNVAIAARHAQALGMQRIMIVDFDVHHGNGTQAIFLEDPDVLYLSTHQWGIYPGSGALSETGVGPGLGATVNLPLPAYAGDETFAAIGDEILEPLSRRFKPEILLVSAGFDSHWRDPLSQFGLTTAGYYRMGALLEAIAREQCERKVLFVLEGGYDPQVLAVGIRAVCHALLRQPAPDDALGPSPYVEPEFRQLLERVKAIHQL